MSASNLYACFMETESFEGGYVNNPHDPGGATLKGVTQGAYTSFLLKHGRADAPVHDASDTDIQMIYHLNYWDAVHGDDLCNGLDLVMVDTCWGSGEREAVKFLQRQIGAQDDGKFGPMTLAALQPLMVGSASTTLIQGICNQRLAFFQSLSTWQYFGRGWTRRLNGIHAKALQMNLDALNSPTIVETTDPATVANGSTSRKIDMTTNTPATPAAPAPVNAWVNDLTTGLDMLQNFNFSQLGDAIQTVSHNFGADPLSAAESFGNTIIKAAAVAGVPFAGTVEEFAPFAEQVLNFSLSMKNIFGAHAAARATSISSPVFLTAQSLTPAASAL